MTPTLVFCSHGTRSAAGQAAIRALADEVRMLLPDVEVVETFVDVQEPSIDKVLAEVTADRQAVVVPVLLSTGYHTRVDIARAVAAHSERAVATPVLGPHDLLALVLEERLSAIADDGDHAIVLAAAGSTDPAAAEDVARMASRLSECLHATVTVGYAAGAEPTIIDAVAAARAAGALRVVAASYVLAPGHFANVVASSGADIVTAPLAPDPRIAAIIMERYRTALSHFEVLTATA